ncbi:hypothetical protein CVT25_012201 [Psilocybe cyanescens]|uniref:DUF7788 domain-containing protein n=1 Tax=Psilocybe cyanescens TaxID=93625 RepID=A0A409XFH5_PSICY|nr:hypothetical protein CVT25_012201 [Psilocybe cyanescens]
MCSPFHPLFLCPWYSQPSPNPPFDAGFITFSSHPEFLRVDFTKSLADRLYSLSDAHWGMSTNLQSDLLLPLVVKNKIKQEDIIKRLFVFLDMQFDNCQGRANPARWTTNHDSTERAYRRPEAKKAEEAMEWGNIAEGGDSITVVEKVEEEDAFNLINVMKKALMRRSFDGRTVVD